MSGQREGPFTSYVPTEPGFGQRSLRGRREAELPSYASVESGIGKTIRAWRRFHGMSVTDLAVAAGFGKNGRGYISKIEHQQIRRLGEERLSRIATALQLQSVDLLIHRMPEGQGEVTARDLDEAIVGGQALLRQCSAQSFDWARLHLMLAKLHRERATASPMIGVKYAALIDAQRCIVCALPVFTAHKAVRSIEEAEQLGREISDALDTLIIPGSLALLKRCTPGSLDWARVQVLRAKCYYERALVVPDPEARTVLIEAQHCVEVALPIFAQKQAQRSLSEARQLSHEVKLTLTQIDGQ